MRFKKQAVSSDKKDDLSTQAQRIYDELDFTTALSKQHVDYVKTMNKLQKEQNLRLNSLNGHVHSIDELVPASYWKVKQSKMF